MRIDVLGCRGSTPATGAAFIRYGGDTSSVAVSASSDASPSLILDAGTGLGRVRDRLDGHPFRGCLLLTHLHWDHTHGIPFAPSLDHHESEVDLWLPEQGVDPLQLLSRAIGPPHFPVTPDRLQGRWRFHTLEEGRHEIAGMEVMAREIPHKGGRAFGYRVTAGRSVAYLPDHAPGPPGSGRLGLGEVSDGVRDLAENADVLLHDGQHPATEWPEKAFLGHASPEYAMDLAEQAGAGRLVLFHHDPSRTDDEIDDIVAGLNGGSVPVEAAYAGMRVEW